MNELKEQTQKATEECASTWQAICSQQIKTVTTKLTPIAMSAALIAADMDDWLDNFGGVAHWK